MSEIVIGEDGLARPPWAATDPLLRDYYDTEWGMPVRDERGVFERLSLEAFQSGLSWVTILRKRDNFRAAFADFDPEAVTNARATVALRAEGGLAELVWSHRPATTPAPRTLAELPTTTPESLALSKALKRKGFTFVGPTTMHALMEAIGIVDTHLVDSHRRGSSGVWG